MSSLLREFRLPHAPPSERRRRGSAFAVHQSWGLDPPYRAASIAPAGRSTRATPPLRAPTSAAPPRLRLKGSRRNLVLGSSRARGERLTSVRSPYDAQRGKRVNTWSCSSLNATGNCNRSPAGDRVGALRAVFAAVTARDQVKPAGAACNPNRRVWQLRHDRAFALDLTSHIVGDPAFNTGCPEPSSRHLPVDARAASRYRCFRHTQSRRSTCSRLESRSRIPSKSTTRNVSSCQRSGYSRWPGRSPAAPSWFSSRGTCLSQVDSRATRTAFARSSLPHAGEAPFVHQQRYPTRALRRTTVRHLRSQELSRTRRGSMSVYVGFSITTRRRGLDTIATGGVTDLHGSSTCTRSAICSRSCTAEKTLRRHGSPSSTATGRSLVGFSTTMTSGMPRSPGRFHLCLTWISTGCIAWPELGHAYTSRRPGCQSHDGGRPHPA